MLFILILLFLGIVGFLITVNLPNNKFNISGKTKKLFIEILWCYLGGLILPILSRLHLSDKGDSFFDFSFHILRSKNWDSFRGSDNLNEFIYGFIITAIIIWTVKLYKKIK